MKLSHSLLSQISEAHGQAFYLLDAERFESNFRELTTAFQAYYPNTTIAYSYKTNYIPRFCQLVDKLGGFAEVVSNMEVEVAERAGIASNKVYFNGPFKELEHIGRVLTNGGVVNADSLDELKLILQVARENLDKTLRIGLRLNFDVDDGVLSRFGFDVGGAAFRTAREWIASMPNLRLIGLHCHFATRTLACWANRTRGMIEIIDRYMEDAADPLEFVSLGGGLYGQMPDDLKAQFPVPIPDFSDYAAVAAKPFAEFFAKRRGSTNLPMLIVEPGTALVADAMKFVARVASVKDVRGKVIATLAGSIYNINPTTNRKNMPIEVFADPASTEPRTALTAVDFGGYTCIESDYLYRGYTGEIAPGDFVVFDAVGSYSVVMKPPFILPNVAIIEHDPIVDEIRVIKRRETFDDLFGTYSF